MCGSYGLTAGGARAKCRGWKETDAELDWDIHWADREWVYEVFDTVHLENWQRVNHYRNGRELCRKDNLIKNIKRMRRQLERDGNWEVCVVAPRFFVESA